MSDMIDDALDEQDARDAEDEWVEISEEEAANLIYDLCGGNGPFGPTPKKSSDGQKQENKS